MFGCYWQVEFSEYLTCTSLSNIYFTSVYPLYSHVAKTVGYPLPVVQMHSFIVIVPLDTLVTQVCSVKFAG